MRIKKLPGVKRLDELFQYDHDDGEIYRKTSVPNSKAGCIAGGISKYNYRFVLVGGSHYQVHRIIWKMVHREEPALHIDHRDGNSLNNKIENLREATASENLCNSKLRSDSTTGIKGISYDTSPKRRKRWRAVIMVDQKYIQVGRFASQEDAVLALNETRDRLHGEFARTT